MIIRAVASKSSHFTVITRSRFSRDPGDPFSLVKKLGRPDKPGDDGFVCEANAFMFAT